MDTEENRPQEDENGEIPMTRVDLLHQKAKEEIKFLSPQESMEPMEEPTEQDEEDDSEPVQDITSINPEDIEEYGGSWSEYLNGLITVEEGSYFLPSSNNDLNPNIAGIQNKYFWPTIAGLASLACGAYFWFRR